ncbi:atpG [Symbiodinium sp. CCMP2592]|nr:atpG [Symbiodinium sp. CCMP2592]
MSGTVELPPEESTLLRASRGLGVAFWAVAIANGLYMIFTLRSQSFWPGLHNLCAGLLLVLVASASGVWEVKAMRSRLDESEGRCLKVGREFFLAGMYFVVAGFLSSPSTASEPQESAEVLGRILCVFGWLLALLRVLLTVIPCMARRGAENETAEPFRTEPSAEPSAEPRTEPRTTRSEGEQEQPREARTVSTPSGLCPDVPRYDPKESGQR